MRELTAALSIDDAFIRVENPFWIEVRKPLTVAFVAMPKHDLLACLAVVVGDHLARRAPLPIPGCRVTPLRQFLAVLPGGDSDRIPSVENGLSLGSAR